MRRAHQQGYVLFTVVVMLFIVAVTAYLVAFDASFEASQPAGELEALRADYVAEAAMQNALWQNGNNACVGDFIIPATAFGADSYTAIASGGGSTSQVSLSVDQDTWIRSDNFTKNHGGDAKNHVKFGGGNIEQALYRFDLSSLAPGTQINSATAWFYLNHNAEMADGPTTVHRVTVDWAEFDATWETMNGNFDTAVIASIRPYSLGNRWVQVNLTAQVQAWVNGEANYGILLNNATEGDHPQFSTRESGGNVPRLDVTIGTSAISPVNIKAMGTLASGVTRTRSRTDVQTYQSPTVVAPQTGAAVSDTFVSSSTPGINYGANASLEVGDAGTVRYAMMDFDLGSIPAGARIVSAELSLNLESFTAAPDGAKITAHRMLKAWTEDGATYSKADGVTNWDWPENHDISSMTVSAPFESPPTGRFTLDVRPLVTEWVANRAPAFGLVLAGANGVNNARFTSSDGFSASLHPSLLVTLACDCSTVCMSPRGSGAILLLVDKVVSMSPYELALQANIEAMGYTVTPMDSNASQLAYDNAAETQDAFFITDTASDNDVKYRLANMSIGVVSIQGEMNDELGMASSMGSSLGSSLNIVDTSNYITQPFAAGPLQIYRGNMEGISISGAEAPGLQTLATWNGAGGLVAIDRGGQTTFGPTPGRRVVLPLGRGNNGDFRWDYLTHNGLLLVQRSIEWATGPKAGPGAIPLLLVVNNAAAQTVQELLKQTQFEAWGYVVTLISATDSQAQFNAALGAVEVVFINEDIASVDLGNKLSNTPVGVVSEEVHQIDALGFSTTRSTETTTTLTIDNDFYITAPFASGPVTLLTSAESLSYLTGTIAPDIKVLGSTASGTAVAALETGATTINGSSPGRRVLLPWSDTNMDFNHLNADGLNIVKRSLAWAADVGGAKTSTMYLSTDSGATLGGLDFSDRDIVSYELWTDTAEMFFDGSSVSLDVDIDALHILANGSLLVSTKGPTTLGGLAIDDGDLVEYDPATDTSIMVFDGSALFADPNEKLTSVDVLDNGHLLLSTDSDATLGGLDFKESDLVEYDRITDTASIYFDGSLTTLTNEISAVQVLSNDHIVLSPKNDATLGGLNLEGGDLVDYDPLTDTGKLLFRGGARFADEGEKINSVHIGPGTGKVSCISTFRDEFDAISFSGSNGTLEWSGAWLEVGESDGADAGDTKIDGSAANYYLETSDNDNGGEGVERELDLGGAASAVLTYDFQRDDVKDADDYTAVFVSANGAAGPWTEVARHAGPDKDASFQPATIDISAYISGNTRIRFLTGPNMDGKKEIWFDNIQVECSN